MFGGIIAALAVVALLSLWANQELPAIREAGSEGSTGTALPPDHPPLDLTNRLNQLEQLVQADPENADYWTELGNINYDLGRYQGAVDAYEASMKLKPGNAGVETDAATCYHNLGRHDRALELLDGVLRSNPDFPQALFNKGVILINGKGDMAAGIAAWEQLLRSHPEFSQRAEIERQIRQFRNSGQ